MLLQDRDLLRRQCRIGDRWVDADHGEVVIVTNPATGEIVGTVPHLGAAEVQRAIKAAEEAFPPGGRATRAIGRSSCAAGSL